MGLGERPGQKIVWDGKAAQEFELALAKARGLGAFRFAVYNVAIMLQEESQNKQ